MAKSISDYARIRRAQRLHTFRREDYALRFLANLLKEETHANHVSREAHSIPRISDSSVQHEYMGQGLGLDSQREHSDSDRPTESGTHLSDVNGDGDHS